AGRSEARPLRLFVAFEIPEPVRELVGDAVAPIRELHPRARWVPAENQHVTLKFLGATWPRLLRWVTEAVEGVARASEPFSSRVEGLGAFPSWRRARVLWAALDDSQGRMSASRRSSSGRWRQSSRRSAARSPPTSRSRGSTRRSSWARSPCGLGRRRANPSGWTASCCSGATCGGRPRSTRPWTAFRWVVELEHTFG